MTLAYEVRRRGDAWAARRKLAVALRLRSGYLMNLGVLRFALGAWRHSRRPEPPPGRSVGSYV